MSTTVPSVAESQLPYLTSQISDSGSQIPDLLATHFDRIAEAPGAIPRLRRFILDLAVRGKLVEQDPNDEPAVELLGSIMLGKLKGSNAIKARKGSQFQNVEPFRPPFGIPSAWKWAPLGELGVTQTGTTPPKNQGSHAGSYIPFIRPSDIYVDRVDYSNEGLSKSSLEKFGRLAPADSLLMVCIGSIGKTQVIDRQCSFNQQINSITPAPQVSSKFLLHACRSEYFQNAVWAASSCTTISILNKGKWELLNLPIPPLAEQHRIVAKADELMALCDQLEAAQAERETRRNRLIAASLHHLNTSSAPDTIRESARFSLTHLPRLTTRSEHIQQFRETIRSLAIQGRLVHQCLDDEPVTFQLIANDKARQETAKYDRRADFSLQSLLSAEDRWEVPASWEWRALADVALFIDYRGQTPTKVSNGVKLITAKNVRPGYISVAPEEFLSESNFDLWMKRGLPKAGDVLFTTEAPMGNAAVVRLSDRFALAQRVICFRLFGAVDPDFLTLQLLAEPFQRILQKVATGLTAKGIKAAKLKRLPIVVPPLAEQHRIVAKFTELMGLCDRLEAQIITSTEQSRRFLEAVLHEALSAGLPEDSFPDPEPSTSPNGSGRISGSGSPGPVTTSATASRTASGAEAASPAPLAIATDATSLPALFERPLAADKPQTFAPPASHVTQTPPGAPSIDTYTREDLLAVIREVFAERGIRQGYDRESAIYAVAARLNFQRVGPRIREAIENALRTAVRRGIIQNTNGQLSLVCRSIDQYNSDHLVTMLLASLDATWTPRVSAITQAARHLGYQRTGNVIETTLKSTITLALRRGLLEKADDQIRKRPGA